MPDRHKPERARRASIPMLWVLASALISVASWLGPNMAHPDRERLFSMSPFVHYSLSVGVWFLAFGAAYLLIERLRLPFGRPAAWAHFGLMALGATLIIAPSVALNWLPPVTAANAVSVFRLTSGVATFGYALTLLSFVVFLGALGRSILAGWASRRAEAPVP